jgi:zinc protease
MGAKRAYSANTFHVSAAAQSLSRDFEKVLGTIAEEMREPAFPTEELDKLKQQAIAAIKREQEDTRARAMERLRSCSIPVQFVHDPPAEEQIAGIEDNVH